MSYAVLPAASNLACITAALLTLNTLAADAICKAFINTFTQINQVECIYHELQFQSFHRLFYLVYTTEVFTVSRSYTFIIAIVFCTDYMDVSILFLYKMKLSHGATCQYCQLHTLQCVQS